MEPTFKQKVYSRCLQLLDSKIEGLQTDLRGLKDGAENDSKSSAGDKHETSRAMMQIEYEKISRLIEELQRQKSELEKINLQTEPGKIKQGSLIETNHGYLFLSAAIGKINADGIPVMVISSESPIGLKLSGKNTGDDVVMNGITYQIKQIR